MTTNLKVTAGPPAASVIHDAEQLGIQVIAARFHRDVATTYVLADEPAADAIAELCDNAGLDAEVSREA